MSSPTIGDSISMSFSMLTGAFPVVIGAIAGFYVYTRADWCNASLGKITKQKCDWIKQALLGAIVALVLIVLMVSRGIGTGGRGGYGGGSYVGGGGPYMQ